MPPALRPDAAFREHEIVAEVGTGREVLFLENAIDDAAPVISPLDAGSAFASAAEAKPFFRLTALARCLDERGIDHDTFFRECDRAVREDNSNYTGTRFTSPARAKDRFVHGGQALLRPCLGRRRYGGERGAEDTLELSRRNHDSTRPGDGPIEQLRCG